jgi:DNA-directed RNA polymerase specialized sigma subunit
MATTTRRLRAARSQKVRPDPCPDLDRLKGFPPPTAWSEQLAADNLQLARAMANRMARSTRMPFDDLFLVAARGLLNGCRRYNPERLNPATDRPYALSTCVVPYIRGAMTQWLRDKGHSSGVRFPDRWRDVAPTVRRLVADGATLSAVVEATGLAPEEVTAILEAQGATRLLDPEALHANREPDPWDEIEGYDELNEVLRIADEAHAALRWADRQMLEAAWDAQPRRQVARMPHGQFLRHAEGIIWGERLKPAPEQQALALVVPDGAAGGPEGKAGRRVTDPVEILRVAEQLDLFGACRDGGGA